MKKLNRKQRNLRYIRIKNNIRRSGVVYNYFSIPNDSSEDFINQFIDAENKINIENLTKTYKMDFKVESISVGLVNDDFSQFINTYKIGYSKA
jgi:hypothetical protein